jgi:hypothetical protein
MQVGMVAMVSLALTVQETSGSEIAPYRVSLDSDHLLSFFLSFLFLVCGHHGHSLGWTFFLG